MRFITRLILLALVLLLISKYIPGIHLTGFYPALMAVIIVGLLNLFIRPILVLLTLPITILTLGLFIFIINGLLFWFASTFLVGFSVDSFGHAFLGSLIMSVTSYIANKYI